MAKISLKTAILMGAAALALPATANAAIVLDSVVPGTNPYSGPTPTFDFESPAPVSGGIVQNVSDSAAAQPFGSTGNYWSVGPTDGSPGLMDLSAFGDISSIGFIWGSVDGYNTLEFLDAHSNVLASFTGNDIFNPANGNQTSPNTNPFVTFAISGSHSSSLTTLRLISTSNAFETDNYVIGQVPEPSTWLMLLLGFFGIGATLRRSKKDGSVALERTVRA